MSLRENRGGSDIYALGVLLYQLVVGDLRRPLAPGWELEIGDEQLRQDIAAASNGSVERRLTSANILAERLRLIELRREQHLDEIKRRAEAHSIHRAVEQARHRRLWQIAAGIALSIGLGTSFWFVRQISLSRNEARSEVAVVRALNDFLDNDVFAGGNPNTGGSMEIAQSVALAKAAGTIDSRYAASPQIAVVLHQTLGGAYRALYQYADAESELRSARTNAYSAFGPDAELSITSDLQLAQVLVHENRYTEAQALLAQIDSLVSKRSLSDPMIPSLLLDAHTVLETHRTNRFAAASDAELERAALDDLRKQHPRTYSAAQDAVLLARLHIGTALQQADQIEQAEEYERILVTDLTDERGASDPLTIRARVRWLTCLIAMHRITEAALEIPALDRDVGARSSHEGLLDLEFMRAKAKLEAAQADWTEAIKLSEAVEAGYGRLFGANNDATILAKADTAGMLRASGQSEAAMSRYSEAYALAGTHQGESELLMQQLAYCIGASSLDAHQPMQANQYLSHLNPAALSAAAPGREWGAHFEYQHGRIALQLGRVDEAKQDFAEAIKLAQDVREASFVQRVEKALDEANALSVTAAIQGG